MYDGVPPPDTKPVWVPGMCNQTGEQVGEQRLWFNAALRAAGSESHMHQRSTMATEVEAIAWAESGLVRWRDALNGTRIQGQGSFRLQYPQLDARLMLDVRNDMPRQWEQAVQDEPPDTAEERCLPSELLSDIKGRQQFAARYRRTLVKRAPTLVAKVRIGHIYNAFMAEDFVMPRVFTADGGEAARHASLFGDDGREEAIAQAMRRVKHAAVPPEMAETAYNVAMSGFAFGPSNTVADERRARATTVGRRRCITRFGTARGRSASPRCGSSDGATSRGKRGSQRTSAA